MVLKNIIPTKVTLPDITAEETLRRYNLIKPIQEYEGKNYTLVTYNGYYKLAHTSFLVRACYDCDEEIDVNKLKVVRDIICYHRYDNEDEFKPTIYEILSQIPEELLEEAGFFQVIEPLISTSEQLEKFKELRDNRYHVSKVRIYQKEMSLASLLVW